MNMQYVYSAMQNNGQITKATDNVATTAAPNDETIEYVYDALKRLISATAKPPSGGVSIWEEDFQYDGFGNLTDKKAIKGTMQPFTLVPETATNYFGTIYSYDLNGNPNSLYTGGYLYDVANRLIAVGWGYTAELYAYDLNGNASLIGVGVYGYDVANRLISVGMSSYSPELYAYDASNKRIAQQKSDGTQEFYFYGVDGNKLGTYVVTGTWGNQLTWQQSSTHLYFAGKLIDNGTFPTDRLGSVRYVGNVGLTTRYYPYGEEFLPNTPNDQVKFATYTRDAATGLDYANQRYYSSQYGRFLTPDQYQASGGPADPQSRNRYSYANGDPTNRIDPSGRSSCLADGEGDSDCGPQDCQVGYLWDPFLSYCQLQSGEFPSCIAGYHFSPTLHDCEVDSDGGGTPLPPPCSVELFTRPTPRQAGSFTPGRHTYLEIIDTVLGIDDTLEGGPIQGKLTGYIGTVSPVQPGTQGTVTGGIRGTNPFNPSNVQVWDYNGGQRLQRRSVLTQ